MAPSVQKKSWRDSLPIDILLSAVYVLVVAQPSSEVPEGLMNYPVCVNKLKSAINSYCYLGNKYIYFVCTCRCLL